MAGLLPLLGFGFGFMMFFIVLLVIWELIWKGIALWYAARNGHKGWFIAILILNTAGILPIIYILCCAKPKKRR